MFWTGTEDLSQLTQKFNYFFIPKIVPELSEIWIGSGIRGPRPGIQLIPDPDPGVKKHRIPDPWSGSATLHRQIAVKRPGTYLRSWPWVPGRCVRPPGWAGECRTENLHCPARHPSADSECHVICTAEEKNRIIFISPQPMFYTGLG
jgi:hypothetical protein